MNNPIAKGTTGARFRPQRKIRARLVLHAGFYDLTWPRDKSGGKHIRSNGRFFSRLPKERRVLTKSVERVYDVYKREEK